MKPASRTEFKEFCKRALGAPQLDIHLTEEQIDDKVDHALSFYWDYHYDGSDKTYFKVIVNSSMRPDAVNNIKVSSGGTAYSNSDTVVITGVGVNAVANVVTNGAGVITSVPLSEHGRGYGVAPTVTITTSTGSGAVLEAELGGWLPVPENIIGAIKIFAIGSSMSSTSFFDIRYQIALNDLYTLTSSELLPYYVTRQYLSLYEEILIGQQPIRFNRHKDRVYLDMDWARAVDGTYIIVEAYEAIDPEVFTDVWGDRWLQDYCIELMKFQQAVVLSRYQGIKMLGGTDWDANSMRREAKAEIDRLEDEMKTTMNLPAGIFVG